MEEQKKTERREGGHFFYSSFYSFPMTLSWLHKCVHIICISPFEKIETGRFSAPHVVCQPPLPPPAPFLSIALFLSLLG